MRKYPRPAGQQPIAQRHSFRVCGLKFCRSFTRGPKYVAIAKILLRFAEAGGAPQPGARVVLGMSQRELGNLLGASREKVNRRLRAWRLAGIIAIEKGTIFIRDPAALQISQTDRPRRMSW